jgi:hypothetical protein
MATRQFPGDADTTLRGLEGYEGTNGVSNSPEQDEPTSDESDLFLRAAKEEEILRQASNNRPEESLSSRLEQRVRYRISSHFLCE